MLSFFKRNKEVKKTGNDSTVESSEITGEEAVNSDEEVQTELSFHPQVQPTQEDRYYYQFLHNELPPLKANQISIAGVELKQEGSEWQVAAFVRNSLNKPIRFEKTPLLLIGPDGKVLARKEYPMNQLGEIPARSSRPWVFIFSGNDLYADDVPSEGWKLAFELKKKNQPHELDLDPSWEKSLPEAEKAKLAEFVKQTPPPNPGEINFMGLFAKTASEGSLQITMLIRNGSDKNIQLEKLPLIVEDAAGDIVAKGGFTLNNLEVKANTSKPWTFIFPPSLIFKDNYDLSKWRAYPPQNS
ncbi:MAG TPA: accessory Sec system S-layer assembly protein [Bacillus sp. (in: firmicutes)]|uniref:accessory Sec system S-layer assembly protein n=1 Tax=Bacillus litorisediminis TaxID=2922713 RepID=UPI001FAF7A47|nr:accessory Sec system S-layer assembly protein [Bacillus litorisediminis]HWO77786.1 accessory Sec system S-layer assembly protein [Bacillus sp. (in: firmicutes)]